MSHYKPIKTFPPGIRAAFSNVQDGSIAKGGGRPSEPVHEQNVSRFLQRHGFDASGFTKVFVTYLPENTYKHVERVGRGMSGAIKSDALFTTEVGKTIILPVADCVATIVYDPVTRMLGVLHLGRHASVAGLIEAFAERTMKETGTNPVDWHVWMSPSLKPEHDKMEYFTPPRPQEWEPWRSIRDDGLIHIDIPGHNRNRFEHLGVKSENIYISPIDTYDDEHYYSHRAATETGHDEREGRMMVAAQIAAT